MMATCHDCGSPEGHFHERGCDMERCPFCGGQLISCNCAYRRLKLRDRKRYGPETNYLPPDVYTHGLDMAQGEAWDWQLDQKGSIPWIQYPNLCCHCGALWPEMFRVSDAEWRRYVQPDKRSEMLCRPCYDQIKQLIDHGTRTETPNKKPRLVRPRRSKEEKNRGQSNE